VHKKENINKKEYNIYVYNKYSKENGELHNYVYVAFEIHSNVS
jgi:hypothetical protein